jgi:uncharacterized protein
MKAVLALIAIYVVAFIIATQGASQNPVQASASDADVSVSSKSIDPDKAADLSSLLEAMRAKDQLRAAANESAVQYREKLRATVPHASNDAKAVSYVTGAADNFQKNFDQQRALSQIADIYNKHYSDDEIRGLLNFYSSPLGQKFAAESPKIAKEIAAVQGAAAASATRESLEALKSQDSGNDKSSALHARSKALAAPAIQEQMKEISARP